MILKSLLVILISSNIYAARTLEQAEEQVILDTFKQLRNSREVLVRQFKDRQRELDRGDTGWVSIALPPLDQRLDEYRSQASFLRLMKLQGKPGTQNIPDDILEAPRPEGSLLIRLPSFEEQMRVQRREYLDKNFASTPIDPQKYFPNPDGGTQFSVEPGNCSAGGFVSTAKPTAPSKYFVYDRDCVTPKEFSVGGLNGRELKLDCHPESANKEAIGKDHFDRSHLCNPLLFGFFPQGQSKKALGLCVFPNDSGGGVFNYPETISRHCELMLPLVGNALKNSVPGLKEKASTVDEFLARLNRQNPKQWKDLVAQTKAHCAQKDDLIGKDKSSCAVNLERIRAIQARIDALGEPDSLPKTPQPKSGAGVK